jgi:hypothetical protein
MNGFRRAIVLAGIGIGIVIAWADAVAAQPLTLVQLQRMLASSAKPAVAFQEVRESPWLSTPATSRGTMRSLPDRLEKQVDSPRKETWALLADRIEFTSGGATQQILFARAPAAAPLARVMRSAVAGDLAALEKDFRIQLAGDERVWSMQMLPRTPEVARYLDSVELQGTQGQLQVIIVAEHNGERTTTRLSP